MKKGIIITVRSNSSRLKNKILSKIYKKNLAIDVIIKRAYKTNLKIYVATTTSKSDDFLVSYIKKKYDVSIYRGNQNNKIIRWYSCMKKFKLKYAGFVDGDDLAFDYDLYKSEIGKLKDSDTFVIKFPKNIITGVFTYIFSFEELSIIYKKTKNLKVVDVIEYYLKYLKNIRIVDLKKIYKSKKIRLTLDYNEDLIFFKKLYSQVNFLNKTKDIINFLINKKKLCKINYKLEKDWKKNQLNQIKASK